VSVTGRRLREVGFELRFIQVIGVANVQDIQLEHLLFVELAEKTKDVIPEMPGKQTPRVGGQIDHGQIFQNAQDRVFGDVGVERDFDLGPTRSKPTPSAALDDVRGRNAQITGTRIFEDAW